MNNFDNIITESQSRKQSKQVVKESDNVENIKKPIEVQLFDALLDGDSKTYDFIANHYWEMRNEDLKTVLLEYIYRADGSQDRDEMLEEIFERLYLKDIIEEKCPDCAEEYSEYMIA